MGDAVTVTLGVLLGLAAGVLWRGLRSMRSERRLRDELRDHEWWGRR